MRGHPRADGALSRAHGGVLLWSRPSVVAAALVCALAVAALAARTPADADVFGTISLLSTDNIEQFEYAHDPVISGDGRYVVFDGSIGGVTGVWRRERAGGNLEQVAGGNAELPSVSENGQFVSFTTDEGAKLEEATDGLPVEHQVRGTPNVYVRDMSVKPGQGAFTLASNLIYEYPAGEVQYDSERFGAQAAGRTAISADGSKVVFVTTAASNLAGPGTPPLEVAVHDMETDTTELVSVAEDPATGGPAIDSETGQPRPVPYEGFGAAYTPDGAPPEYKAPRPFALPLGVGASISADGTTVAWMGQQIAKQARALSGERLEPYYSEPLWRRIADGQQAPTRRVTGGSDPVNPACAAHPAETIPLPQSNPCQGPFTLSNGYGIWHGGPASYTVQLSGDGEEVAFLATAPLVSQGEDFGTGTASRPADLYVADMREGISRDQALTQLTELAGANEEEIATDSPILDLAISPDGTQVAFTTKRTVFHLGSPAFVSTPAAVPGLAELFDVDLPEDTVTRVTHGYLGEASERPLEGISSSEDQYGRSDDGSLAPSFSADGKVIAFSSTAANLIYGDGNSPTRSSELDGSDAFSIERLTFDTVSASQVISEAPPGPAVTPQWRLGVTALSLGDGDVLLYVRTPSAGALRADAQSSVPAGDHLPSHAARRSVGRRQVVTRTVTARNVAPLREATGASVEGLTTLTLTLAPSYRALAAQRGGLSATAHLTFTAPGHPALRQSIAVSFVRATRRPKRAAHHPKTNGHRRR